MSAWKVRLKSVKIKPERLFTKMHVKKGEVLQWHSSMTIIGKKMARSQRKTVELKQFYLDHQANVIYALPQTKVSSSFFKVPWENLPIVTATPIMIIIKLLRSTAPLLFNLSVGSSSLVDCLLLKTQCFFLSRKRKETHFFRDSWARRSQMLIVEWISNQQQPSHVTLSR